MTVRLYGRDVGNGSLAVVTRGFREALAGAGLLDGFVALDRGGGSEEEHGPPGALARDGIFTGNLNMVPLMQRGARHERHWVQVTPNSTFVPKELLGVILKLPSPRLLSCSRWGTQVIIETLYEMGAKGLIIEQPIGGRRREIVTFGELQVPIVTARHGISGFTPDLQQIDKTRADYQAGEFRVIHFSTTAGERKGTLELVKAWALGRPSLSKGAQLFLVLDYHASAALSQRLMYEDHGMPEGVSVVPRADLDAPGMSTLLGSMHLVACPSRGEGFGLLPLQARAAGVPVIATQTTGHSAGHVQGGGVLGIEQRSELRAIDDGPAALAQGVRPEDIASALRRAQLDWWTLSERAVAEAAAVGKEWSWTEQLAPLLEQLR